MKSAALPGPCCSSCNAPCPPALLPSLPQPQPGEARAAGEAARHAADKASRLAAVEELLWGSPALRQAAAAQQPSRWNPAGGLLGRLQARALQRVLGVAVQLVRLEVQDVTLRYVQVSQHTLLVLPFCCLQVRL